MEITKNIDIDVHIDIDVYEIIANIDKEDAIEIAEAFDLNIVEDYDVLTLDKHRLRKQLCDLVGAGYHCSDEELFDEIKFRLK